MNTTAGADIFLNLFLHGTVHYHLVWIGYGYYAFIFWCGRVQSLFLLGSMLAMNSYLVWFGTVLFSFLFGLAPFLTYSCLVAC
jgi:hypothetical protein